jgi:hypothetical protein
MTMGAIEPTLPAWMLDTMHPKKWQLGKILIMIYAVISIVSLVLGSWFEWVNEESLKIKGPVVEGSLRLKGAKGNNCMDEESYG